jgi:hypothetical protein
MPTMMTLRHSALLSRLAALSFGVCSVMPSTESFAQSAGATRELNRVAVEEVLNQSLAQKKGLAIYIGGQTINAIFVKRIDDGTIEVRNQQFGRILIRIDRIDAIAIS